MSRQIEFNLYTYVILTTIKYDYGGSFHIKHSLHLASEPRVSLSLVSLSMPSGSLSKASH